MFGVNRPLIFNNKNKRAPLGARFLRKHVMTHKWITPLISGALAAAFLMGLGVWQLQRLAWKQAILGEMTTLMTADPVPLPQVIDPVRDRFLPVFIKGRFTGQGLEVLTSQKDFGQGYRAIAVLRTDDGRRILIDRGFIPEADHLNPKSVREISLIGNVHWPAETDSFTPKPDESRNLWFVRDAAAMAKALDTEPVFIVARTQTGDGIAALPVDTSTIANDHLNYALTWFSLALVCLMMTVALVCRIKASK